MYTRVKIIITKAPDGSTLTNVKISFQTSVLPFVLYFVCVLVCDNYFILLENTCATTIPLQA